jgi:hypothetical protein
MTDRNITGRLVLVGLLTVLIASSLGFVPRNAMSTVPAASTPAASPDTPAIVQFNATSIQKTAPAEAIQQIDLRLGGGGYPSCLDIPDEPTLDYKNDNLDLTDIAVITSCGWQPDETVKVTLMDPQGKFYTSEVKAFQARQKKGAYEVDVFFQPGADAPEGKYRFTLQGTTASLKAKIAYNRLKSPKLYALPEDRFRPNFSAIGGQQRLRLQGFLPNEPVRLLAYTFEGTQIKFYAWQDFTTDRRGQLIIETNLPEIDKGTEMNFYAYGRDTHFVALDRFTVYGTSKSRQFDMDLYCPGTQAPRLNGPIGILPVSGVTLLDIHQQPGFGSRVTTRVAAATAADVSMQTYGYPKCIDHAYWWKVSLSKPFMFGWVAESFLGKYLVEPVKK